MAAYVLFFSNLRGQEKSPSEMTGTSHNAPVLYSPLFRQNPEAVRVESLSVSKT